MKGQDVLKLFQEAGAILTNGHFVYTSKKHGDKYVNKDGVYLRPNDVSKLCFGIAETFMQDDVEVVIAPAVAGAILSSWTAYHLTNLTGCNVLAVYADKNGDFYVIRRNYDKVTRGKKVLVVEDIITTGGTVRKVVNAVHALGADTTLIGVAALCNRGDATLDAIGNPPKFHSLLNLSFETYEADECPLCAEGIPVNTNVGKGQEFLSENRDRFLVCPSCGGLARYINKERRIYHCPRCGAVPAGLEFE